MTICERMFCIMQEKNKKAADLCRRLNISTAQTTSWKKRNTDPPAKYLIEICNFLEVSIFELLGQEPNNEIDKIYKERNNEIERIYKMLSAEDKQIVDIIFNKYREQESQREKSSGLKIG